MLPQRQQNTDNMQHIQIDSVVEKNQTSLSTPMPKRGLNQQVRGLANREWTTKHNLPFLVRLLVQIRYALSPH